MNKCFFTGRTTKDVDLRYTNTEPPTAFAKTAIAIDTGYKDKKHTDFFNITVWGKLAETFEKYVVKGTKIFVECNAVQQTYTNKDGQRVNTVDFRVVNFEFAETKGQNAKDRKPKADESGGNSGSSGNSGEDFMEIPDDLDLDSIFQ